MSTFGYDPEAIYQDADIEMMELEQAAREVEGFDAAGGCTHGYRVGYLRPAVYIEQEYLRPGEEMCYRCGKVATPDELDDDGRVW